MLFVVILIWIFSHFLAKLIDALVHKSTITHFWFIRVHLLTNSNFLYILVLIITRALWKILFLNLSRRNCPKRITIIYVLWVSILTALPNILILCWTNIFLIINFINILRRVLILKRFNILWLLVMMICHVHCLWISIILKRNHHLLMRIPYCIRWNYWCGIPHLWSLKQLRIQLVWIRRIITENWACCILMLIHFLLNHKRVISYIIHSNFIISNNTRLTWVHLPLII